jgi:cyclopropane-fatty-acyl-phospholipid synthase
MICSINYIKVFDRIFSQFDGVGFSIVFWDGETHHYGKEDETLFSMTIKDNQTAKRLLGGGSIGFGEAYMSGQIIIEGELDSYLKLRHQVKKKKFSLLVAIAVFLARRHVKHSRQDQIAHHYDIGNDFFEMFLDTETMSYSCGMYATLADSLAVAQQQKLEHVCHLLDLLPYSRVLDLGSGWGGFATYAAKKFQWNVKGYTLSNEQLIYARKMAEDANLSELVSFEYKDIVEAIPKSQYDGAVMIEAIEHVGKKNISEFIKKVATVLVPGAPFVVQATIRKKLHSADKWTLKYIFPGGYLPSKEEIIEAALEGGFSIERIEENNQDYVCTVSDWIKNLESNRYKIENKYGKEFYRMWELWLHGTRVGFEMGSIGQLRVHLKKII